MRSVSDTLRPMPDKKPIIVHARRPKPAPPKKRKAAALAVPAIVTTTSRKRAKLRRPERETKPDDDPEADARVKAFFARMIRPRDDG